MKQKGPALSLSKGFSLIELMVVIAIIGVLTSIGIISFSQARNKANIAKAKGDLSALRTAVSNLELDTGLLPGGLLPTPCVQNQETYLNAANAGIMSNNGTFTNWSGPYMSTLPKDPWGREYYFDPDYTCYSTVEGCKNVANGATVRAVVSLGKVGSETDYNDGDNVVQVLCQ